MKKIAQPHFFLTKVKQNDTIPNFKFFRVIRCLGGGGVSYTTLIH